MPLEHELCFLDLGNPWDRFWRCDEIIETIYRDSFRVEFIGFLVLNIPDLICIGQDKFDMTFQNDEYRIPKTSGGFYSQPLASVI